MWSEVWQVSVLGGGFAVVFHTGDGGFAEETVLVVHQMLVDAGFAGLVGAGLEDGGDGVGVTDGAEVFLTGWCGAGCSLFGLFGEKRQHQLHLLLLFFTDVVGVCMKREVFSF